MNKEMPPCPCGVRGFFEPYGGGVMGSGHSSFHYYCAQCRRSAIKITQGWLRVFLIDKHQHDPPQYVLDYANTTLMIVARSYSAKVELLRERYIEDRMRELAGPFGFDYNKGCRRHFLRDPDDKIVRDGDGKIVFEYQDSEGNRIDVDARQLRDALEQVHNTTPAPSMFLTPPILPQMPKHLVGYVWHADSADPKTGKPGCWRQTDPEESATAVVPTDPLRKRHDDFDTIFEAVEKATGQAITRQEIPNRYYPDLVNSEPWFAFRVGEVDFVAGPRKRVINFTMESETFFPTENVRSLAERDNVTYYADKGWKGDQARTKEATIHAWDKEKAIEYLTAMIQASLKKAA